MKRLRSLRFVPLIGLMMGLGILAGCRLDMRDQPRYEPLEESTFFADKASARPRIADTEARNQPVLDDQLHTGRVNGQVADSFPFTVTVAVLERGQERYNIYCIVCHGPVGNADGMIVRRGFPKPPTYHDDRLRNAPVGHFFDVITNGFGRMNSYAAQVQPADRWAIVAYIRTLQLSQNPEEIQRMNAGTPANTAGPHGAPVTATPGGGH